MSAKQVKHELQNIISGKSGASYDAVIQTVLRHLRGSKSASPVAQGQYEDRVQETKVLKHFAEVNKLILSDIPADHFIANGAEQRVYIVDDKRVLKLNDGIYYASWSDYFCNLLIHNYFFSDTQYRLNGFHLSKDVLYAVVEQPYIRATQMTNLNQVKQFMQYNGFKNTRRHDYKNEELGLILEDLHDENVLTAHDMLYFIDTVFFITPKEFWAD